MDIYLWILIFFTLLCVALPLGLMWAMYSGVKKGFKKWDDLFDTMEKASESIKKRTEMLKEINEINRRR